MVEGEHLGRSTLLPAWLSDHAPLPAPPVRPQELEGLDDAALRDLYEMRVAEQRAAAGREDFSGAWAGGGGGEASTEGWGQAMACQLLASAACVSCEFGTAVQCACCCRSPLAHLRRLCRPACRPGGGQGSAAEAEGGREGGQGGKEVQVLSRRGMQRQCIDRASTHLLRTHIVMSTLLSSQKGTRAGSAVTEAHLCCLPPPCCRLRSEYSALARTLPWLAISP